MARFKAPLLAAACLAALGLAGCATLPAVAANGNYAKPIGSAPVTSNPTPYTAALMCIGEQARAGNRPAPSIAVGRISDYTGQLDATGAGSTRITQGAALMAMTAFGKAGFPLVERFDTSITALELDLADAKAPTAGISGSDYYLVGGITELNSDIRTTGTDVSYEGSRGRGFGSQVLVMNVGIDLRLIDSRTLRVVDMVSYQKQVVARQIGVNLFDVLGGGLLQVSAGTGGSEPLQMVVRAMIERGVAEMGAGLYGMRSPAPCLGDDPIARRSLAQSAPAGWRPAIAVRR